MNKSLTSDYLRTILNYNPQTGIFKWNVRKAKCIKIGDIAGYTDRGYIKIFIDKRLYAAHRLAWLYMTDDWPQNQIDHINRIKNDNRWSNLRDVTGSQNKQNTQIQKNNTTGAKGVCWHKRDKKYQAQIRIKNKRIFLGYYNSIEDAKNARVEAETKYFGRGEWK